LRALEFNPSPASPSIGEAMSASNCDTPDAKNDVRILVAAADRPGRENLRDLIASWDPVVRAVTGDQVLEQVQSFAPQVLLLDLEGQEGCRSCFALSAVARNRPRDDRHGRRIGPPCNRTNAQARFLRRAFLGAGVGRPRFSRHRLRREFLALDAVASSSWICCSLPRSSVVIPSCGSTTRMIFLKAESGGGLRRRFEVRLPVREDHVQQRGLPLVSGTPIHLPDATSFL
jgi:hypothetical protein